MSTIMASISCGARRLSAVAETRHFSRTYRTRWDTLGRSVSPMGRRVSERAGALVAEEVVSRQDVVDLETLRAGIALADVALQEVVVVDDAGAFAVIEERSSGGSAAGLAGGRWRHPPLTSRGPRGAQGKLWDENRIPPKGG